MRVVFASTNAGKLREVRNIFEPHGLRVLSPEDLGVELEAEETGSTFAENALIKMRSLAGLALPALADDSGLIVDALGGEPGVLSARYGGPGLGDKQRAALVLARLQGVPAPRRTARFEAAVACRLPGMEVKLFRGLVEGFITTMPRGEGGFGYDPIFYFPPYGRTFAELTPADKDEVSHRGQAMRAAADYLVTVSHPRAGD